MTPPKSLSISPDTSRTATDAEKLAVLSSLLAAYPCRVPSEFRLVQRAYMQALEGVCQWALFEAERRINQGSLGHPFMPSPAELRGEIDRVMQPFLERERRAAEERRRYAWAEDPPVVLDEATRARMVEGFRQLLARLKGASETRPPPRPPPQGPDYSEEPIEISDALQRILKAKDHSA